jgi:hypothetical protein
MLAAVISAFRTVYVPWYCFTDPSHCVVLKLIVTVSPVVPTPHPAHLVANGGIAMSL